MIFKMLVLEQSAESGLLASGEDRPTTPIPLGYGDWCIVACNFYN